MYNDCKKRAVTEWLQSEMDCLVSQAPAWVARYKHSNSVCICIDTSTFIFVDVNSHVCSTLACCRQGFPIDWESLCIQVSKVTDWAFNRIYILLLLCFHALPAIELCCFTTSNLAHKKLQACKQGLWTFLGVNCRHFLH